MSDESTNPFTDAVLAARYEKWYADPGQRADRQERALLLKLLPELSTLRTNLDVGCRTGHFTRWFRRIGYDAVGLDSSAAMLADAGIARPSEGPVVSLNSLRCPQVWVNGL